MPLGSRPWPRAQRVEAAGIEPASRGTSASVSTCVAGLCLSSALVFAFPCPGRQGRGSAIGQEFNDRRLRIGPPCDEPQATASPTWLPRRDLSGEGPGTWGYVTYAAMENCGSAVIVLVSFLRGQLTNHGTPRTLQATRSIPDRPLNLDHIHYMRDPPHPPNTGCVSTFAVGGWVSCSGHWFTGDQPMAGPKAAQSR
jgi:hypothetical protein